MGTRQRGVPCEELTLDTDAQLNWKRAQSEPTAGVQSLEPLTEALARDLLQQIAPIEALDVVDLALGALRATRVGYFVALDPTPALRDSAHLVERPSLRVTRWIGDRTSFDTVAFVDGVIASEHDFELCGVSPLICCRRAESRVEALALAGSLTIAEVEFQPDNVNCLADAAACCSLNVATDASEIALRPAQCKRTSSILELLSADPACVAVRRAYLLRLGLAPELLNSRIASLGGCVVVKLAQDPFERVRRSAFQACAAALHAAALHGVARSFSESALR